MNENKVALVFFGITRSLRYCIESIEKNIFNELKKENILYDIYQHTYTMENYSNKRTKEKQDIIDNNEYKLLQANYVMVESQEEIKEKLDLNKYRTHEDPWNTNYNSVDNMILGNYSKKQATSMVENSGIKYNYIIFIRPDCLYLHELKLEFIKLANDNTIIVPNFHLHAKKLNDRFAITNIKTYKIYGYLFDNLLDMSKKMHLHSETILERILRNNNINIKNINFRFKRIRCNGQVEPRDKKIN